MKVSREQINSRQIAKIWASAKEHGLEKEDVYSIILSVSGKEHMTELTWNEANDVINRIVGDNSFAEYESKMGRKSTQRMRRKIYVLTKLLGWDNNPKRIEGFCKKMFKVEKVEWLNETQCYKLIEALKKIVEREEENGRNMG